MATEKIERFKHVNYLWDDAETSRLDPVGQLIYRSNILGSDQRITNTGGGNTSAKIIQTDPMTGEEVEVLWVKGSGGDLRTSEKANFASLYQEKIIGLQKVYRRSENRGLKSAAEDAMVGMYPHCVFNLNPRATSIDTPLHAFIPYKHVDHMHPNTVIAIAAAENSKQLTEEIYGGDVIWVPWMRPGFELGLLLQKTIEENPQARGILLAQHGIINWADTSKDCYETTLELIEKAGRFIAEKDKGVKIFGGARHQTLPSDKREAILHGLLPKLRGLLSDERRFIATTQTDPSTLQFVNSHDVPRLAELGTSCPDHFLRTKIKPLYVDWAPASENVDSLLAIISSGLKQYRTDYADYYNACRHQDSPPMRIANPTVILIPGIGMVAWGKNKSESRVTAEFYACAVDVMYGAETLSRYQALPAQEAFDIEYWALEEAKLRRMPEEKEMADSVVVIVGAGSGIGRETAFRFAEESAHIVCADIDQAAAEKTVEMLLKKHGKGIGVSGTGISGCGPAIACRVDVTNRASVKMLYKTAVAAYGGIDHVVMTAGIFIPPDKNGRIPDEKWGQTYDINVTGGYRLADEARMIWQEQELKGTLVLTTSVNATVSKKGSLAYDTSKAAADHLVRELAIELSPLIRVNGVAPATVVQGSSMFPRDRVIASLLKYNIEFSESETTGALRDKLAHYYADRTLIKTEITPADQAEAIFLLCSQYFSKTTGQIVNVDGGLHEAFLR